MPPIQISDWMEAQTVTFIRLALLTQSVILLHSINEAVSPEDVNRCDSASNYLLHLNSTGCFCCPTISDCQFHPSSAVKWYRCSGADEPGAEEADSCHLSIPSRNEQLSVWVHEVGKICFTNFTHAAVGKYCCTPQESVEESVKRCQATISVQLSVRPEMAAVKERLVASNDDGVITLQCYRPVEGAPNPCVYWRHNGLMINNSSKYQIITSANYTKLTIHNVTLNDSGRYVCEAIVHDMTSSSLIHLNVSGLPSVLGAPLFMYIHNWTDSIPQLQQQEITGLIRTTLQSYLDQNYEGVFVVLDWLLLCCCSTSNKIYKFRLNGTQATTVSQLLVDTNRLPITIGDRLTISNSFTIPPTSHTKVSGKMPSNDNLIFSGMAVLSVVLVCLMVIIVLSYQWKKTRSQTRQVPQVHNRIVPHDYNKLSHTFDNHPARHTAVHQIPDYLPLESPARSTD